MMLILCVALALMNVGLFVLVVAISRAYCDMEQRAKASEALWAVTTTTKPDGWFGSHES